MCGITGFISNKPASSQEMGEMCGRMTDTLRLRGPDDAGIWTDSDAGIALGHRRLSILDLSPLGKQPMISADGRYVIVFNGEVYNYRAIRHELEMQGQVPEFNGQSDTEVILAAISAWGLEAAVEQFIGMFAMGVWDRKCRVLFLVRDRLGKKPLYYGWAGNDFVFGSELKALRAHPGFKDVVHRGALALYLRYSYVPGPYSVYTRVFKLLPGHILTIPADALPACSETPLESKPYWSAKEVWMNSQRNPWQGSPSAAVDALEELLADAVRLRMISDVPLGGLLSGGVDSSTVVALMQANSTAPVNTYTIGVESRDYDESAHAEKIAKYLGTNHTTLYVHDRDAEAVIPQLSSIYDEPFADSSQIPTFLLCKLARQHVTVALSGDAGDELFFGYPLYANVASMHRLTRRLPMFARTAIASLIRKTPTQVLDIASYPFKRMLASKGLSPRFIGSKLHKLASVMSQESFISFFQHWKYSDNPPPLVSLGNEPETVFSHSDGLAALDELKTMQYLDVVSYLVDDLLAKVDRASMAVSLEVRVPILDQRIVEFAAAIPQHMNFQDGKGKWLLRKVLERYVPNHLTERPKQYFSIPMGDWLRGPLKWWVEDLLDERKLKLQDYLELNKVRRLWTEHLSGNQDNTNVLWSVLVFRSWCDN
jgi:asparagine synthase (glutamine-hydrolysing)